MAAVGAAGQVPTARPVPKPRPIGVAGVVHPEDWPLGAAPLPQDAALEARVQALLASMPLEQKVGQIVQADIGSATPEDVRRYRLGSILAGGNSDPGGRYDATPAQWLALADAYYRAAMDATAGTLAIPPLFGIDAVHGHGNVVGATLFPHNIGLGAARDPELVGRIAAATAREVRATGMDWTFAPTLTVPRDVRWGRTYEGYSEDPALVASYAGPVIRGLQGEPGTPGFLDGTRVLASAKHFLGDGGTTGGRDQGDSVASERVLRDVHAAGYPPAIAAGVQTVMASFSSWHGRKMHGNRDLLVEVLRNRMGFDGFVIGDWNAHGQLPGCTNTDCPAAFIAGVDVMMTPDSWRGYYDSTLAHVRAGRIPQARLDEAVARVLRAKLRLGLFEAGAPSQRALGGHFDELGSAAHRALAREAVRKSLVLIKNDGGLLPLDPRRSLLVAGDGADNVAKQAGGWTLTWQGSGTKPADFPHAQSIGAALVAQVEAAGGRAWIAPDGRYTQRPDAAVVVFGEEPYAEFQGDLATLEYKPGNATDRELLLRLRAAGIPVVAVFLSGRPLWVNREINASDAFVAAWLPGSEGGGVADVLLRKADGTIGHDFHGTLSYSWPRSAAQAPVDARKPGDEPQFPLGYGLRYGPVAALGKLSEAPGVPTGAGQAGVYFAHGEPLPGFALALHDAAGSTTAIAGAASGGGGLRVAAADHAAQEDALRFAWSGADAASVALQAAAPIDLSRESNGDVLLVSTLRVERAAKGAVALAMDCVAHDCTARVAIHDALVDADRRPFTLGIALKCWQQAGADLSRIGTPWRLEAAAGWEISVSRVALGTDADRSLACPAP